MGVFNNLMSKIFGHASAGGQSGPASGSQTSATPGTGGTTTPAAGGVAQTGAPGMGASGTAAAPQNVDVAAVLDGMAAKNSEKLDWKRSIVDLMKLVGMDSSLSSRKELAKELNYTGDTNDSAAMNIWLHKQVLKKLSENGGKVPQELLS